MRIYEGRIVNVRNTILNIIYRDFLIFICRYANLNYFLKRHSQRFIRSLALIVESLRSMPSGFGVKKFTKQFLTFLQCIQRLLTIAKMIIPSVYKCTSKVFTSLCYRVFVTSPATLHT